MPSRSASSLIARLRAQVGATDFAGLARRVLKPTDSKPVLLGASGARNWPHGEPCDCRPPRARSWPGSALRHALQLERGPRRWLGRWGLRSLDAGTVADGWRCAACAGAHEQDGAARVPQRPLQGPRRAPEGARAAVLGHAPWIGDRNTPFPPRRWCASASTSLSPSPRR
jgi:hypothetical protein